MDNQSEPLPRTVLANSWLTVVIIIAALFFMVVGNSDSAERWQFLGADVDDALNNIGLALLIAGITQYYTDFRVRSKFYKDVSDHIVANETLRESGIMKFFRDSKHCIPHKLITLSSEINVGVTFSDRFLKDNIGDIAKRADHIKIKLYCTNIDDQDVRKMLAKNLGLSDGAMVAEFEKLKSVVRELRARKVNVEVFLQNTVPHYSFYSFDNSSFFCNHEHICISQGHCPSFSNRSVEPYFGYDKAGL